MRSEGGVRMTDGEKALSEFGYIRDETIYTPEGYELDYGFVYMQDTYCVQYYGHRSNGKILFYTVSFFDNESGEPLGMEADLLQAALLRLQELNQAVI